MIQTPETTVNLNGSNTDGSFAVAGLSSFGPYRVLPLSREGGYLGNSFCFDTWTHWSCPFEAALVSPLSI